ncbi:hypothetical protein, partial [Pallidibacillus thermolactis]|uniref:hypothetical protein n=1 Tax=Pallidibacillus thermolactis TaxID=251051 RepID=UPI0021D90A0D
LDMEKTMSSLNKIRILENDEQKKTNPNSNEAFELGFVDSLKLAICEFLFCIILCINKNNSKRKINYTYGIIELDLSVNK